MGFLDSGVGGLSIWWEAVSVLPSIRTLYWADQAHCPYGTRTTEELQCLVLSGVETLQAAGCSVIVLACNTATAAAVSFLRARFPTFPFVGMEPAVKPAALQSQTKAIGILATSATCHGHLFLNTSARYARDIRLIIQAADDLVLFVERGELDSPALRAALSAHLEPMLKAGVDHIVLGCTHFPFLAPTLQALVGPAITLVDPAPAVARQLARILHLSPTPHPFQPLPPPSTLLATLTASPHHTFLTTTPPL